MAWTNFTPPGDDDDDQNNSGGSGTGGGTGYSLGVPPPPSAGALNDVTDMLIDYNERYKAASPALYRDQLVDMTMATLISKTKPNPLLEGSAGVGKTKIVEEIARLIANGSSKIPKMLQKSTIWELPLANIVAGGGLVGEIEKRVTNLVEWATDKSNDAIIFIDEIHLLQSNDNTYSKIAQILKPALARGDMRVIGATTGQEARKLDEDPAFARRFSRIVVDELTPDQAAEIVRKATSDYSRHFKNQVILDPDLARRLVDIADETSTEASRRPDNALTLMDRTMADMVVNYSKALNDAENAGDTSMVQFLRSTLPMSVSETKLQSMGARLLSGLAKQKPFNEAELRQTLTSRIKGQSEILEQVIETMARRNLSVFSKKVPQVMMFAGASGVGKTETAKVMARALTGQDPLILNMAEYSNQWDESKLLGSGPGYVGSDSNRELPFDSLKSNPHRLIILDEMEKSHENIHRIFLSAFDQGWIRMARGNIIDFSKAIIVMTTNAGKKELSGSPGIGFNANNDHAPMSKNNVAKALYNSFSTEFLGRIEHLLAFQPINKETYRKIFLQSYWEQGKQVMKSDPNKANILNWPLDDDVVNDIVETTYVAELGARPAVRAATMLIEDTLLANLRNNALPQVITSTPDGVDDEEPVSGNDSED